MSVYSTADYAPALPVVGRRSSGKTHAAQQLQKEIRFRVAIPTVRKRKAGRRWITMGDGPPRYVESFRFTGSTGFDFNRFRHTTDKAKAAALSKLKAEDVAAELRSPRWGFIGVFVEPIE